jgi:signal transduction histidine kinase
MTDPGLAGLVDLACHDLRTPLATVNGFTKTILRAGEVEDIRYVELIDEAASQIAMLVDQLGLAARISSGRYDPHLVDANTLELAAASGVPAFGEGAALETDADTVIRALTALGSAAVRFGAESPAWTVTGRDLELAPNVPAAATSDVGAIVARIAVEALGGSVELDGETLRVRI